MLNPWKILGIHRKSTDHDIRERYKAIATQYHPDMATGYEDRFVKASKAYHMLKNKKVREKTLAKYFMCKECSKCRGVGAKAKSAGITGKVYTACAACHGAGLIIKEEEEANAIEL